MKFFLDTANVDEILPWVATGLVDGITTNPTLVAKAKRPFHEVIREICDLVPGPVSAEVISTQEAEMRKEAEILSRLAPNVVVKLPVTPAGLTACYHLTQDGIETNMTLCFSPAQALLAAKAGATYISPFIGRLDDVGHDGLELVQQIVTLYSGYPDFTTQVLAASARNPHHVVACAMMGVDVVTLPPALLGQLYNHPLTDKGLEAFLKDWENAQKA
jgi:transaldolase